jgi:Ulp1 family protease
MRTNLHTSRQEVVAYFIKAMRYYRDKEMLVIPFNTSNHWINLLISTKYDQVWYCDSLRSTDPITDDRLTYDWTDVITILDEYLSSSL